MEDAELNQIMSKAWSTYELTQPKSNKYKTPIRHTPKRYSPRRKSPTERPQTVDIDEDVELAGIVAWAWQEADKIKKKKEASRARGGATRK